MAGGKKVSKVLKEKRANKTKMTNKFKALLEHNKKQFNFEEIHALYKHEKKQQEDTKKPRVVKFTKSVARITKPTVPLVKTFYEKHLADEKLIREGLESGKFVEGTLYFDQTLPDKWDGFVKVEGVEKAVKIRGL